MVAKKLIIFGAGGFGSEIVWVAESANELARGGNVFDVLGYVDDDPKKIGTELYGYKVLGTPIFFIVSLVTLTASEREYPSGKLKEIVAAANCP